MKMLSLNPKLPAASKEWRKIHTLYEVGINMLPASKHYEAYINKIRYAKFYNGVAYLLMDLAPATLESIIAHVPREAMQEETVCHYIEHIAKGVQALHEQDVMHRDLKSENILLSMREPHLPEIADMGLAKELGDSGETGSMFGAHKKLTDYSKGHFYNPPEIALKVPKTTFSSYRSTHARFQRPHGLDVDIWQLAYLSYQLRCHHPPFANHNAYMAGDVGLKWFYTEVA